MGDRLDGRVAVVTGAGDGIGRAIAGAFVADGRGTLVTGWAKGGKSEALSLNRKGIEFSVLQREAESNRQVYEALLQRTKLVGDFVLASQQSALEPELPRGESSDGHQDRSDRHREYQLDQGEALLGTVAGRG